MFWNEKLGLAVLNILSLKLLVAFYIVNFAVQDWIFWPRCICSKTFSFIFSFQSRALQ